MEILNNIWVTLSTPNEWLLNLLLLPINLLEATITMYLFFNILGVNYTTKQKVLYVISISLIGTLTMYIIPTPFSFFITFFATIVLTFFIFKNTILKSTTAVIISLLLYNLIGILILTPFITIFNIDIEQLNTIPIYKLSYIFIIYSIILLVISLLRIKKFKLHFLQNINKKNQIIIFLNLLLGILTIIVQSIILFYYVDKSPKIITFFSFISIISYFIISISSLTKVLKLELTTQKLKSEKEYNNTLRILHDNVRAFKHDFDNIITTIGGYIKTNDIKGLQKYYSQLEDDCQRVNNLYILSPTVVNNDGIYNLLTKKYYEAEAKNIKVNITFLLDLDALNMKIYEFSRILGILLDNAIEASSECEEKIINISFNNDHRNNRQLIIIENTYNNQDVDTEKIFGKGVSGKENHTGLGLWEVRELVKKNTNINLFTSKNDKYFSQQLEIYYNKKT